MSSASVMHGMLVMLAQIASREQLVELLSEAVEDYKKEIKRDFPKEDEHFKRIVLMSMLLIEKSINIPPDERIKMFEDLERVKEIINPRKS